MIEDKFHDECAVVGVVNVPEAAKYCYLGLYAMQHRGQEGAGIVSTNGKQVFAHRDTGLVADVFSGEALTGLEGSLAIGHTRYATFGRKDKSNLQPLSANFLNSSFSIAHNGNLVNARSIRDRLEKEGSIFSTTSDTETFLHLIAKAKDKQSIVNRVIEAARQVEGAYSLVVKSGQNLIAVRDPAGVRPLSLGKLGDGYMVASETCAFDLVGAELVREIEPGEVLRITDSGELESFRIDENNKSRSALCVFEYVYFSRPDSVIDGKSVYAVRKQLGSELAGEHPVDADYVIPVPDSGSTSSSWLCSELQDTARVWFD